MINTIKNEMESFGFNEKQIEKMFNLILFIGVAQNLAWRENEGVLIKDVFIEDSLLNYLKQGLIKQAGSKYQGFPVYILDNQGESIFNHIFNSKLKIDDEIISRDEFKLLNQNIFSLLYSNEYDKLNSLREFEDYKINPKYKLLFENTEKGVQLKKKFLKSVTDFIALISRYNLYFELTNFNSKGMGSKNKIIVNNRILIPLLENIQKFYQNYHDSFDRLNRKIDFYDKLILSVDFPDKRIGLGTEIECQEIINKLSSDKITTNFDSSNPYYFKIINTEKFKQFMEQLKQNTINQETSLIIDEILEENIEDNDSIKFKKGFEEILEERKENLVKIYSIEAEAEEYKFEIDKNLNIPLQIKLFNPANFIQTVRVDMDAPSFIRNNNKPFSPRDIPQTKKDLSNCVIETTILVTPPTAGEYNIHFKLLDKDGKVIPNSDKDVTFQLKESKTKKIFKFIKGVINITIKAL